jgi:hypothetical protein
LAKVAIVSKTNEQRREMRRRRPSRSAQLREPRRTIELVSFLQYGGKSAREAHVEFHQES